MKQFFLMLFSLISLQTFAQILEPVKWKYECKKVAGNNYELHITAFVQNGWHLYSQTQPEDAIAIPTTIKFAKNSLLNLIGKIKEIGKLEKTKEPTLGIESFQYEGKVYFVQIVQLKIKTVKTIMAGTIEFQTCTNEKCLPPKTINFRVKLNE